MDKSEVRPVLKTSQEIEAEILRIQQRRPASFGELEMQANLTGHLNTQYQIALLRETLTDMFKRYLNTTEGG